jgi:dihydroneopterin aldolase
MDPMAERRIAQAALALRHVFIRDLVLAAAIGVHAHERGSTQRIRLNIDLGVEDDGARSLSRTGTSRAGVGRDELSRVVDYGAVVEAARRVVASGHVALVETLAERIAEACLVDPRVRIVRVRVEKLDVFADAAAVGVEIERRNDER